MTVIDLQDQREARRRARFEEFCAAQERALAETRRIVDELTPLIEQWLEYQKKQRAHRRRGPICEAPRCRDTITTLHAIPGATPGDPQALIAVCDGHLSAVLNGLRVTANSDDTLTWRFNPVGAAPVQLTVPRKRGRRVKGAVACQTALMCQRAAVHDDHELPGDVRRLCAPGAPRL